MYMLSDTAHMISSMQLFSDLGTGVDSECVFLCIEFRVYQLVVEDGVSDEDLRR